MHPGLLAPGHVRHMGGGGSGQVAPREVVRYRGDGGLVDRVIVSAPGLGSVIIDGVVFRDIRQRRDFLQSSAQT